MTNKSRICIFVGCLLLFMAAGPFARCESVLRFNNNSAKVDMGSGKFNAINDFTIEAWIKDTGVPPDSAYGRNGAIAGHAFLGSFTYGFGLLVYGTSPSEKATLQVHVAGSTYSAATPYTFDGEWHHLAGVRSGATLYFYLDGQLKTTLPAAAGSITPTPATSFQVGSIQGNFPFRGYIAELRLWNCARSATEISSTMYMRVPYSMPNLLGCWPMNEGSGTTAYDSSGNNKNGAITSCTWEELTGADIPPPDRAAAFEVENIKTGSSKFTCSSEVKVTAFTMPPGYTHFQINRNADSALIDPDGWLPASQIPQTLTFDTPEQDELILFYAWYTDSTGTLPLALTVANITYTTAGPDINVRETRPMVSSKFPCRVYPLAINAGTTGGVTGPEAGSKAIGLESIALRMIDGPYPDATPTEPWVTISAPGEYTFELLANNEAGLGATSAPSLLIMSTGAEPAINFPKSSRAEMGAGYYNLLQDFTLSTWVKASTKPADYGPLAGQAYLQSGVNGFGLYVHNNGNVCFQLRLGDNTYTPVTTFPFDNQWHHLAAVREGATVMLYLDGVLKSTVAGVATALSSTRKFALAQVERAAWDFQYLGSMSDVRLWNRALPQAEIQETAGVRLSGQEPGLIAYWPLNEGEGGIAGDMQLLPNDGALLNTTWYKDSNLPVGPGAIPPAAMIAEATNVTSSSAWLNGMLLATGDLPTSIAAYWGQTDFGTNSYLWPGSFMLHPPQEMGNTTIKAEGLLQNATYYYRLAAVNANGAGWSTEASSFFTGSIHLEKISDPKEYGEVPGVIRIHCSGTPVEPIIVNYEASGTAVPGEDYEPLSGVAIIPKYNGFVDVEIKPYYDHAEEDAETVILTLLPGAYVIGSPSSATVEIEDYGSVTCTWTGGNGTGDWFDPLNWDILETPRRGATVKVPGPPTINLTGDPAPLASFIMNGGTLSFAGWDTKLVASHITLNNGIINHAQNTATAPPWEPNARVHLECSNLTIAANGTINVSEGGFIGQSKKDGLGPGFGAYSATGGGHGGIGHPFHGRYEFANTYDDPVMPALPGSSGGAYAGFGGNGGGVVFINAANAVRVDGKIIANGGAGSGVGGVGGLGGAGGSVLINCATFEGADTGLIETSGGGDGSGGGRIALHYNPALQAGVSAQPEVVFRARPGGATNYAAAMGSLYLSDSSWVTPPLNCFDCVWLHGEWLTNLSFFSDIFLTNSVGFATEHANVNIAGNVMISNACLGLGPGAHFHCNDLVFTNQASMTIMSAFVTMPEEVTTTPLYGALVEADGEIVLNNGCWIYPQVFPRPYNGVNNTNGLAALVQAGAMTIATNAGVNSDKFGFPGGSMITDQWGNGEGAGAGPGFAIYGIRAATHGGLGGGGNIALYYGNRYAPVFPGSGGAPGSATVSGASGGGAIRLKIAGLLTLDGILTANASEDGNGAGGSIFVSAAELHGSETSRLSADGSTGGGGGRIACAINLPSHEQDSIFAGKEPSQKTVVVSETYGNFRGEVTASGDEQGSICFLTFSPCGTVLTIY